MVKLTTSQPEDSLARGPAGELLDERHELLFVEYLRLCFRFGGFPGFDGADERPAAIDSLAAGLQPF
jgi:hypothetical protein